MSASPETAESLDTPRRAVVLLSGGLDSAVTLAIAGHAVGFDRCTAVSFDYGQRHRHELDSARRVAAQLGLAPADHTTIRIDLGSIGGSALTDSSLAVPKDTPAPPSPPSPPTASSIPITYVPARNLIFLSCAAGLAEVRGASFIYLGVNAVDYSGYPDCREPFIRSFEQTVNLGTRAGVESKDPALRIRTPLVHLTKAEIIRRGHELGVDFSLTHSCYDPVKRAGATLACGHCDSCLIRKRGFEAAGIADPTRYA